MIVTNYIKTLLKVKRSHKVNILITCNAPMKGLYTTVVDYGVMNKTCWKFDVAAKTSNTVSDHYFILRKPYINKYNEQKFKTGIQFGK